MIWNLLNGDLCLLRHLFICSVISNVSVDSHVLILCLEFQCGSTLLLVWGQLFQLWPLGALPRGSWVLLMSPRQRGAIWAAPSFLLARRGLPALASASSPLTGGQFGKPRSGPGPGSCCQGVAALGPLSWWSRVHRVWARTHLQPLLCVAAPVCAQGDVSSFQ